MAKYLDDNGLLYFWGKLKAYFVAKEAGKGLSTNDFTDTLKTDYDAAYTHSQADHAPSTAEANVQSDWNQADTGADDYIKNKPTIPAGVVVDQVVTAGDSDAVSSVAVINYAIAASTKGQANGVASLGADGLVPSAQLPSYVDDVVELLTLAATAPASPTAGDKYYNTGDTKIYTYSTTWGTGVTPEASKIYIALDTDISYRWGGSVMVKITSSDVVAITNGEIDTIYAS